MLQGDVTLLVFDFCRPDASDPWDKTSYNWWHQLVHVCQRWRQLIFASPHTLKLQLLCSCNTPVRKKLDSWPQIPIAINDKIGYELTPTQEDNLLAAFEHSNHIYSVTLRLQRSQMEKVVMIMQKSFPMLTHLHLSSSSLYWQNPPILPLGFLCGYAPHVQEITLSGLFWPATFVPSTSGLVKLHLFCLPNPYPSPEEMIKGLSAMTRLESLTIDFERTSSYNKQTQTQSLVAPVVLPSLIQFQFQGHHLYLEDLISKLDTPQLFNLTIEIFYVGSKFNNCQVPKLVQFIKGLKQAQFTHANINIVTDNVNMVTIYLNNAWVEKGYPSHLILKVHHCDLSSQYFVLIWQLLLTAHLLLQAATIISTTHHLSIVTYQTPRKYRPKDKIHDTEFLGLLHPFLAIKTLHIGKQLTKLLFPAPTKSAYKLIQVTQALPALHLLNLEGLSLTSVKRLQSNFKQQLIDHPLTIVENQEEFERLKVL